MGVGMGKPYDWFQDGLKFQMIMSTSKPMRAMPVNMQTLSVKLILCLGLGLGLGLAGCAPVVKAPAERNVCFLITVPADGKMRFIPLAKDVSSIELCSVHLYNKRRDIIRIGVTSEITEGVYNGQFLFADNRFIKYSKTYEGPRFPLLVKTNDGRLVAPGTIVQESEPVDRDPVTIPDNLPQKPSQ